VPHDEWEVLYRERLQVERDLLAGDRLPGWVSSAIAALGFALVAVDLVLALVDRRRSA
jgi:hypothetical protein